MPIIIKSLGNSALKKLFIYHYFNKIKAHFLKVMTMIIMTLDKSWELIMLKS